mmetsp:Transcript_38330/g.97265  ORF Transcript_38330/g.97265 Transcript_38330/m.97265 type:complete len:85 (+) Transcript_38330:445-699(+)
MCCLVFRACFGGRRHACKLNWERGVRLRWIRWLCVLRLRHAGPASWEAIFGSAPDSETFEVRLLLRAGCGSVFCIDETCAGANP